MPDNDQYLTDRIKCNR